MSENDENLKSVLMLKYAMRFRELYKEILQGGCFIVFAKEEALEYTINEFLTENPDVSSEIMCKVFYLIGDLSHNMNDNIQPLFKIDDLEDLGFENIINKS